MALDLNCDMGELPEPALENAILPHISSANIACGAHAGDPATMLRTAAAARRHGVSIGAHPGYPDRENFGRVALAMSPPAIADTVYQQIQTLATIAPDLVHVKPHGALYNVAAKDAAVARAIAEGVARFRPDLLLFGLAGSVMLDVWRGMGFRVAAEGFADRCYEPDGSLRWRTLPGALIDDPDAAAAQAVRMAGEGRVQTICLHSDTPGAVPIAAAVARALRAAGCKIEPL